MSGARSMFFFMVCLLAECMGAQSAPAGLVRGQLPVLNEPYSLVEVTTQEKPDANGTTTTRTERHRMRDSAGRERLEVYQDKEGAPALESVLIFDPVANTTTRLLPGERSAIVTHLQPPDAEQQASALARRERGANDPAESGAAGFERLASRTIAGVTAVGTRHTTTMPRGWNGSRNEVTLETDVWRSPELGIELLRKSFDPVHGNSSTEVTQLTRSDPDSELFRVPADYKTEEKTAARRVLPPAVLSRAEPEFSEEARKAKLSGSVLVALTVDERGLPTKVHVVRGIGHGLDEKAMEAVKQYKFRPAMQDGKAVPFDLNVEVNFQIFDRR